MVGLWGVDDDDDEEEEDDNEEWCPGPLKRVPFNDARLTWPARLGAAGDWGLGSKGAEEGEEGERGPRAVMAGAAADSGLVVLPRGAWRPVGDGGKQRKGKGSKKRGREGGRGDGDGDGDGEGALSPKATDRFVLRGAGEVGEEMAGLVMVDAPPLGMDGSEEGEE